MKRKLIISGRVLYVDDPDYQPCSDYVVLTARSIVGEIEGAGTVRKMMYVPAGDHQISCGCAGKAAAEVCIRVDSSTAAVLNASLEWSDSPSPGVYAKAELTQLGKSYVDGKVMRGFSGSFITDADLPRRSEVQANKVYRVGEGKRGSRQNPARIIGLDFPYAGTLTNNPAFHGNLPLWAAGPNWPHMTK